LCNLAEAWIAKKSMCSE